MTADGTSRRRQRRVVFSHDGLRRRTAPGETARHGGRWIAGFVAAAICQQHDQIRAGYIADLVTRGDAYADAPLPSEADSCYPRIHLDGDQLVYDQRHVVGDSDAVQHRARPDRRYRLGLGARWYRVAATCCDLVHAAAQTPTRRWWSA